MSRRPAFLRAALCQVALLLGGAALADGAPRAAGGDRVLGQATFRCQGGVRVQVTLLTGRAQVNFAGQTRTLNQADGKGGVLYQSGNFAWVSDGRTALMRDTRTGRAALSGCVQVQ